MDALKIESTLQVAFHLHCMGSDVEDMIHWLTIRSGRDEDVLENALSILADLFSLGNNMVYETFVFRQGRQKEMKHWPAFLPDHTNWHAQESVLSWILQSKCKSCVITYYPGSEQALCKPELMADRFLNTKWVVVPAEIQTQHRKNDVKFIIIPKGNKTIFPESQASRNSMDFEKLIEAEVDILCWKIYSFYTALLIVNKKYFMEFILSPVKITEDYRREAMVNLKKIK